MTTAPTPPYLLAIDAGAEAIKAALVDPQGHQVAVCAQPYQSYFPRPSRAVQDAEAWRRALVMAVRGGRGVEKYRETYDRLRDRMHAMSARQVQSY